jgi:hypothetical protein
VSVICCVIGACSSLSIRDRFAIYEKMNNICLHLVADSGYEMRLYFYSDIMFIKVGRENACSKSMFLMEWIEIISSGRSLCRTHLSAPSPEPRRDYVKKCSKFQNSPPDAASLALSVDLLVDEYITLTCHDSQLQMDLS